MTLISNACLYSQTPITGWFIVNPIHNADGLTSYQSNGKYASARENGSIEFVDNIGAYESFHETTNGLAYTFTGEGPRVISLIGS